MMKVLKKINIYGEFISEEPCENNQSLAKDSLFKEE